MIDPVGGSVSIIFPLFSVTTNGSITNMLSETSAISARIEYVHQVDIVYSS